MVAGGDRSCSRFSYGEELLRFVFQQVYLFLIDFGFCARAEYGEVMGPPCTSKDDKLKGHGNYTHWKYNMRVWFIKKGYWGLVNGTETRDDYSSTGEWEDDNASALSAIARCLGPEITPLIHTLTHAHAVWSKLEDLFARDSPMRAVTLQGSLYGLKFSTGESMQSFLTRIKSINDQLMAIDAAITSSQLASLVLTKVPDEYDMVAKALRSQLTDKQLDFEHLSSLLLEEEIVLIGQGKLKVSGTTGEQALAVEQPKKKRKPRCFTCNQARPSGERLS